MWDSLKLWLWPEVYGSDRKAWWRLDHGMGMFPSWRHWSDNQSGGHDRPLSLPWNSPDSQAIICRRQPACHLGLPTRQWPKARVNRCTSIVRQQSRDGDDLACTKAWPQSNRTPMRRSWAAAARHSVQKFDWAPCSYRREIGSNSIHALWAACGVAASLLSGLTVTTLITKWSFQSYLTDDDWISLKSYIKVKLSAIFVGVARLLSMRKMDIVHSKLLSFLTSDQNG